LAVLLPFSVGFAVPDILEVVRLLLWDLQTNNVMAGVAVFRETMSRGNSFVLHVGSGSHRAVRRRGRALGLLTKEKEEG
jgi:hypothetical protein